MFSEIMFAVGLVIVGIGIGWCTAPVGRLVDQAAWWVVYGIVCVAGRVLQLLGFADYGHELIFWGHPRRPLRVVDQTGDPVRFNLTDVDFVVGGDGEAELLVESDARFDVLWRGSRQDCELALERFWSQLDMCREEIDLRVGA
jgi:hypothetical protein